MTPAQVTLIQDSFARVAPVADSAASVFYARLFTIAPQVEPLFKADMTEQGAKLMATLGAVVNGLNDLDAIVPVARDLAVRHVAYGVQAEHYAPVGDALIFALNEGLGDGFTLEVKEAWLSAYRTVSGAMIDAAYSADTAS